MIVGAAKAQLVCKLAPRGGLLLVPKNLTDIDTIPNLGRMFNFLKSADNLEREFKDWAIADRTRILGYHRQAEARSMVEGCSLPQLMAELAADITRHTSMSNSMSSLTGWRGDAQLDNHYHAGAKKLHALLKKRGWGLTVAAEERLNSGIIVVDLATRQRVG